MANKKAVAEAVFTVQGATIKIVLKFKYLGRLLSNNDCDEQPVNWIRSVAGSTIDIHSREATGSRTRCLLTKYKPENIATAVNYTTEIAIYHSSKLKLGDEKHLKGAEIFVRGVRQNPITGVVPDTIIDSDFLNT
jgi:hypothetical protein